MSIDLARLHSHPTVVSFPTFELSELKLLISKSLSDFAIKEFDNFSNLPDLTYVEEYINPQDNNSFSGLTIVFTFGRSTKQHPNAELSITLLMTGQYSIDFDTMMTYEFYKIHSISHKGYVKLNGRDIKKPLLSFLTQESKSYVSRVTVS